MAHASSGWIDTRTRDPVTSRNHRALVKRLGLALLGLMLGLGQTAPASAQELADYDYENLVFRGVGFDVGAVWPSNLKSATSYRLRVDLGYLGPGLRIVPTLTYWSSTMENSEIQAFEEQLGGGVDLGEIDLSDLALGVDAQVVWTTPIDLLTYLGAGVGIHALNGQGDAIDDTFIEDLFDSFMPGVSLLGGVEYGLGTRLRIYGEGRYTIVSDITYPAVTIGAALMFPARVQGGG